jgi:hypothetical protein
LIFVFFSLGSTANLWERICPVPISACWFLFFLRSWILSDVVCVCVCVFVIGYVFHFPYCRARRFVSGPHLFLVHFAISFWIFRLVG